MRRRKEKKPGAKQAPTRKTKGTKEKRKNQTSRHLLGIQPAPPPHPLPPTARPPTSDPRPQTAHYTGAMEFENMKT
jgi:hypothetical protein